MRESLKKAESRGGRRKDFLPFSRPSIGEEEIREVVETLRSGWLAAGPRVDLFEKKFRDSLGVAEAVAVSSGTAGLHLALLAAGVGPGDEVITSSMTFAATANVIALCGAKPVLVDCDSATLNISVEAVEEKITRRTRAIIPVHFAGQPCAMDEMLDVGRRRGLVVIEDAAHALGTEYKGRKIGTIGDMTVFSFQPIKAITTGEGGMVVTNNCAWAERIRLLRFHGIQSSAWQRQGGGRSACYEIESPGFKYTMMDLQAALGIHQIDKLEGFIRRRSFLAGLYDEELSDVEGIDPLARVAYPHRHAWHLYVVQLELERFSLDRNGFIDCLRGYHIGAGIHFPAVHLQPYYREKWGYKPGDFPCAGRASDRILSLPLFPDMTEHDVEDVVEAVKAVLDEHRR